MLRKEHWGQTELGRPHQTGQRCPVVRGPHQKARALEHSRGSAPPPPPTPLLIGPLGASCSRVICTRAQSKQSVPRVEITGNARRPPGRYLANSKCCGCHHLRDPRPGSGVQGPWPQAAGGPAEGIFTVQEAEADPSAGRQRPVTSERPVAKAEP